MRKIFIQPLIKLTERQNKRITKIPMPLLLNRFFFDRNDELPQKLLSQVLEELPVSLPSNYVPSIEKYAEFIVSGLAYGMVPDQQSRALIQTGQVIDLSPDFQVSAKLYWHCWSLKSKLLNKFTQQLTHKAKTQLDQ